MDRNELVAASATASAQLVGTDAFFRLLRSTLSFTGDELARHLDERDRPGLLSPIDLEKDGKDRQGAILALDGRAIIVWTEGVFRMKPHEVVIPTAAITEIDRCVRPGGAMTKARERLVITAHGRPWAMVFAAAFDGGRTIVPFIGPALHGGVRPEFENG